ncbi:MAG: hypothetical protein OEM48_03040 [Gammaproteobacteria bacterium]|nr:hypothetical protein [Gammaproteobacteria bacterium]MDH3371251.1 hypothetical protein [Gammaproteobacteria bacterium]MDH3405896.1 hypothetical protein [Gammaproteobacteria bacterium]MDH3562582.1 hypothetical protein [Gammaproteobacteria bacterium]MDH5486399.1 hypothetical protein [Gammaproteobacteria bacterium]
MNQPTTTDNNRLADLSRLKTITTVVYVLQAVTLLPPFVITYVIAVMLNYIKRDDVRGTWLDSHFRWQIRTFWFSLPWFVLGALTYVFIVGWVIIAVTYLWLIYRILKGGLNLYDGKPMYATAASPPV